MKHIDNMVVYGMGKVGRNYVDRCLAYGIEKTKLRLTDSDKGLWGKYYKEIEIQNPDSMLIDENDTVVIAVSEKYKQEIAKMLKDKYYITDEKIIFSSNIFLIRGGVCCIGDAFLMDMDSLGTEESYDMWYELYKLSLNGMNIGAGGDVEYSGELNVLKLLKLMGIEMQILFDVGANIGEYTKALHNEFPKAQIHSFEPAKETFRTLSNNVSQQNVVLNNVGIGNKIGKQTLYFDEEKSGLASLYNRQLDYFGIAFDKEEQIEVITLDAYCQSRSIYRIDFLKMDIEGNEHKALLGATKLLKEKRIGVIQIETGGANIDSRTYFRDYWNLLHDDFDVFRILQKGLKKIEKYDEDLECFITSNWLFVKKNNK